MSILLENVTKRYGEQTVLSNINVSFENGKIHGLVGRNGSGKTQLFKVICGYVIPESGNVWVDGKKVGKDVDFPSNIGVLIESPGFLMNYSGLFNLELLAAINTKLTRNEIKKVMELVGLGDAIKKRVGAYSLGMRQRLGIAQAIMDDPQIIILDEPFNGLDNEGVYSIRKLLLDLKNRGKTIILASHNPYDIEALCDSVYEMDAGVISKKS
jgi:ABC-type multidrug transport system, ATPase component